MLNPDPNVSIANLIMEMIDQHWHQPQDVNELREIVQQHWETLKILMPRLISQAVGEFQQNYENTDVDFERFWNQNQNNLKMAYWGNPEFHEHSQYFSES